MRLSGWGAAAFAAMALSGCAPWHVYEATRVVRVNQCLALPVPEQEECMRGTHETREELERRQAEEGEWTDYARRGS